MARRKGIMPPPSGSHTGPMSSNGMNNGTKTMAVGHTAPGRPGRRKMRKKRRG